MKKIPIPAGSVIGRWTVAGESFSSPRGVSYYACMCTCGAAHRVQGNQLRNRLSLGCRSCNSGAKPGQGARHGASYTPTYRVWAHMLDRCRNAKHRFWRRYGGRGISVCARWHVFENFLADMGERPAGRSIDRIDNDGNYEPGNCRWATHAEQQLNHPHRNGHTGKIS